MADINCNQTLNDGPIITTSIKGSQYQLKIVSDFNTKS